MTEEKKDKPKGLLSPWAPKPVEPVDQDGSPSPWGDELVPARGRPAPVVFPGRTFSLYVTVGPSEKAPQEAGKLRLGLCLEELFQASPKALETLRRQGIDTVPPLDMKVILPLGKTVLYVKASSFDIDLALRMAVDRLSLALMECRSDIPKCREILTRHRVEVVRRT